MGLPSVTLARPRQSIHGLVSFWVCAAGLSSSSRSLLGNLLRRLAPRTCQIAVKQSFNNMRIIVSLGWAIYPAGYFLGQINDSAGAAQALNVTYNIADFVNKIAFVLACWSCAKEDSDPVWTALASCLRQSTGSGLLKADGAAGGFDQQACDEAAAKLISNHSRVVKDICNPSPKTQ